MSDPLERLRGRHADVVVPDADSLRARARTIATRRHAVTGAAIFLVVALGFVAVVRQQPSERSPMATAPRQTASPVRSVTAPEPAGPSEAFEQQAQESVRNSAPRSGADGSAPAAGSAAATADRAGLRAELVVGGSPATASSPTELRLSVCNDSRSTVQATFATAQRYDFEVARSDGTVVWRWSDGRMFAQARGTDSYAPGCRLVAVESWDGRNREGAPVPPGPYSVTGLLTAEQSVRSAPKTVCAGVC